MAAQDRERSKEIKKESQFGGAEELPYRVEIWEAGIGLAVERVLARAFSATLARAIFKAAIEENPGRRITLARGDSIIDDSGSWRK